MFVSIFLASMLVAGGHPAAAQFETTRHQHRLAQPEVKRSLALRGSQGYLDRPHSYTAVRSVPFNYGADFFPSWRQILPKY